MKSTSVINPRQATGVDVDAGFSPIPTRIRPQLTIASDEAKAIPEVLHRLDAMRARLASIHRVCCETYLTQGCYEEALTHQKIAVQMDPQDVEYRNQLGFLRYVCGDDGAVEDFQFVIGRNASSPEGYFNLGMIYFGQAKFDEAERQFAQAAERAPDDAEVWNNLGVARFQLGHSQEAKKCFEQALRVQPDYEDARVNLAGCSA